MLPLLITTNKVRTKVKDMRESMAENDSQHQKAETSSQAFRKAEGPAPSKGDYIDFEELN